MRQRLGRLEDFETGRPSVVTVGRRQLAVVRWGDEVFAVRNVCPHQGGPLGLGSVRAGNDVGRDVGQIALREADPVLVCPWHGWEFDARTGAAAWSAADRVRSYPTVVEDGVVFVELDAKGR